MSKAKELAREIEDKYSRSKIWDMRIDSDISDIVYLAIDLSRTVLSEPEPLRGWIEVGVKPERRLFHLLSDKILIESGFDYCQMAYFHCDENNSTTLEESYDEIKQKIARAG